MYEAELNVVEIGEVSYDVNGANISRHVAVGTKLHV